MLKYETEQLLNRLDFYLVFQYWLKPGQLITELHKLYRLSAILYKGDKFLWLLLRFPALQAPFENGSTLIGKNLIPKILFF